MQPGCQNAENQKNRSNSFNRISQQQAIPGHFAGKSEQPRFRLISQERDTVEFH
ncbi:hypothetical protein RISK_006264 [Rhodopirellula islandica]|uniref:Uncharacterized protein n=1 Tax=Rhodopirellula islandica TaxID=595434 RepID=A0A0J1B4J6_RHOIS|nr:hypothetical protein RISK_006264 [Rhodopirellula islandica]